MEIHHCRYIVAIASAGNFSRAAERCGVSQPSLSDAIQRLENELEEKLIERLHHKAVLTPIGEMLLKHASRILDELQAAELELREAHSMNRGGVTIGVLPTIAPYFLPHVIVPFKRKWPKLNVLIDEETTNDLLRLVYDCEADFAIVTLPITDDGLEIETLFTEELLVAVHCEHPLAKKKVIRGKDLENQPFIVIRDGHCLADQTHGFFNQNGFNLQVTVKSHQLETVQALVSLGGGISFVPAMARANSKPDCMFLSLERPKLTRTIAVVWRKHREHSQAAAAFLTQLRETAKKFGSQSG